MRNNFVKYAKKMVLILYVIFLVYIFFGRTKFSIVTDYWNTIKYNVNIRPFQTIRQYMQEFNDCYAMVSIVGNIIILIPFGYMLFQRKSGLYKSVMFSILLIVGIEVTQLFTLRGICDIDDLILNTCGVAIGYLLAYVIRKTISKRKKSAIARRGQFDFWELF